MASLPIKIGRWEENFRVFVIESREGAHNALLMQIHQNWLNEEGILKQLNTPLFNLLGGLCFSEFPAMRALTLKPPEETAGNALKFQGQGYTRMKLKVGLDQNRDVAALKAVRKAVADTVSIKLWNVCGITKGKEIAAIFNAKNCFCHIATTPGSQIMEAGRLHLDPALGLMPEARLAISNSIKTF